MHFFFIIKLFGISSSSRGCLLLENKNLILLYALHYLMAVDGGCSYQHHMSMMILMVTQIPKGKFNIENAHAQSYQSSLTSSQQRYYTENSSSQPA